MCFNVIIIFKIIPFFLHFLLPEIEHRYLPLLLSSVSALNAATQLGNAAP